MKDPAALLYIDKWIAATRGMKGAAKGWYLDLILYQYDKGSIPNDLDEMAAICSVRPSEYDLFRQMFEQVLKHKFELNDDENLENSFAKEIIQKRQRFIEKRSNSGKLSYISRYAKKHLKLSKREVEFLKDNIDLNIDLKNEQVLKQMIKQTLELYINIDENESGNVEVKVKNAVILPFTSEEFRKQWNIWKDYKKKEHRFSYKTTQSEQAALNQLSKLSNGNESTAIQIIHQSLANSWKGLFELKNNGNERTKYTEDQIRIMSDPSF